MTGCKKFPFSVVPEDDEQVLFEKLTMDAEDFDDLKFIRTSMKTILTEEKYLERPEDDKK